MPDVAAPAAVVETPQGGAPETPETPASPPAGQGGASDKVEMTRAEYDRQMADLRRTTEKQVKESQEMKDLRARAKRADELDEATKTETERLTERATKAEQLADERAGKYREALIRSTFTIHATAKGIPADRIDAAFKLADRSAISIDEATDTVSGVEAAIDALPDFLKTPAGRAIPDINGGGGGGSRPEDAAAHVADAIKRYRLNPR